MVLFKVKHLHVNSFSEYITSKYSVAESYEQVAKQNPNAQSIHKLGKVEILTNSAQNPNNEK